MTDRECFIREPRITALHLWLTRRLGALEATGCDRDISFFRTASRAAVTVTPNIESGPFTSVYVVGEDLPWRTDVELARDAFAELGGVVRCTLPDEQGRCLEISAGNEAILDIEAAFGTANPHHLPATT